MKIGICANQDKDKNLTVTRELCQWLAKRSDIFLYIEQSIAELLGDDVHGTEEHQMYANSDMIIVLGGDGTLLGIARKTAEFHVPLLAVNLGRLGFLAEIEVEQLYASLDKILQYGFDTEERTMLEASIVRDGKTVGTYLAFNDIGLKRGTLSRIGRFNIYINEHFVDVYSADGVLISTPTGSTGYALSAGGSILCPNVKAFIMTPICAHNLYSRSIVISDTDEVRVECIEDNREIFVTIDGQMGYTLNRDDSLVVRKAEVSIRLVKISERSFFDILRNKITER